MNRIMWALIGVLSCVPFVAQAQTKIMDVEVYYISRDAKTDSQSEQLARRLLAAAETKINTDVLPPSAHLEFRITNFIPWDPPNPITYEVPGIGTVTDYNDLVTRLVPTLDHFPASRLYLALTPGRIGFWSEGDGRVYQAFGAIDQSSQSRVLLGECMSRPLDGLVVSFLHELGHMADLPDRRDDGCNDAAYIMCSNSEEREIRPVFGTRYRKSFYALVWYMRARNP